MTKQKKEETAELMISIDQFTRTRDSVIVSLSNLQDGLSHVQNGINDLLRAYMNHTSSILAGESGQLDSLQVPLNALEGGANAAAAAATGAKLAAALTGAGGDSKRKRKREKKERDPNAPKRPLTAAFLYSQHARPIIRRDLEAQLPPDGKLEPNAVNLEVTKRWNEMPEDEKELWRASYRKSMEEYKAQMEAHTAKTGEPLPEVHEEEGTDEAEAGHVETDAEASDATDDDAPAVVAPVKAPTPPPAGKTPRPAAKRQRTMAAQVNGNTATVPVPIAAAPSPVPLPIQTARSTAILPPGTQVDVPTVVATPAKKDKAKKDKKKAAAVTPAKEPEAEEGTKKKSRTTRQQDNDAVEATPVESKRKSRKKNAS